MTNALLTLINENDFTAYETAVVTALVIKLEPWIGVETYSPVEHIDIAEATGLEISQVKGVVGSLVKKNIVQVWEHDEEGGHTINFVGQETMVR
mgnify:FL=1|jgi:DNA-binding MarR family transcriptional regulator